MSKFGLIVASFGALATMGIAFTAWRSLADLQVDTAGYIAWAVGGLATLAGGGVLLALLFWSNRKGFDDRAGARPELQRRDTPHQE